MRVLGAQPMLTAAPRTRWRAAAIRSANGQPGASGPPRAPCHRGLSGRTGGRWLARGSRQEARPPLLSRCGRGGSGRGEGALGREARRGRPSEHALPEAGAAAVSLTSPRAPRPPRFRGKSGEEISALATRSREPAPALAPPPSPRPTLEEPVLAWRRPARKRPLVEATVGEASPSGPVLRELHRVTGAQGASGSVPLGPRRREARRGGGTSQPGLARPSLPLRAPDRVLRATRRAQPPAVTSSGCWRQCKAAGAPAARSRDGPSKSKRGRDRRGTQPACPERGRDLLEDTAMLLRGPPGSFTVAPLCLRLGARASVTRPVGRISLRGDQKATGASHSRSQMLLPGAAALAPRPGTARLWVHRDRYDCEASKLQYVEGQSS